MIWRHHDSGDNGRHIEFKLLEIDLAEQALNTTATVHRRDATLVVAANGLMPAEGVGLQRGNRGQRAEVVSFHIAP
jgi:hypothetical protein